MLLRMGFWIINVTQHIYNYYDSLQFSSLYSLLFSIHVLYSFYFHLDIMHAHRYSCIRCFFLAFAVMCKSTMITKLFCLIMIASYNSPTPLKVNMSLNILQINKFDLNSASQMLRDPQFKKDKGPWMHSGEVDKSGERAGRNVLWGELRNLCLFNLKRSLRGDIVAL